MEIQEKWMEGVANNQYVDFLLGPQLDKAPILLLI